MSLHLCVYMCVHMYVCLCVPVCECVCTCVHVSAPVFECVHVCAPVCKYLHACMHVQVCANSVSFLLVIKDINAHMREEKIRSNPNRGHVKCECSGFLNSQ